MKRRTKKDPTAWRETPAGMTTYQAAKAEAQAKADSLGCDMGLEANDLFKNYQTYMLPAPKNRCGRELRCEVVMCTNWDKRKAFYGGSL